MTGLIFGLERFAVHDGPGIRTTVFFKGCPLRCWWCHSPESQSDELEARYVAERCIRCGTCLDACPNDAVSMGPDGVETRRDHCTTCGTCTGRCPSGARDLAGRAISVEALLREIDRDTPFHDRSGGGVTLSGGEPLMQPEFLEALIGGCRSLRVHTAVETSGFGSAAAMAVACMADLVLFDLKLIDDARHREVTGASNAPILANLERAVRTAVPIRARVPLVPAVNDDAANLDAIGALLASLGIRGVDVLPYHTAGAARYARLGREYRLSATRPPAADAVADARRRLEGHGLSVHVGG